MDSRNCRDAGIPTSDTNEHGQIRIEKDKSGQDWLGDELRDCGVPAFGLNQWLLHFMREALKTEMPDGKLLNFFCLARDQALNDEPEFVALLEQVEIQIYGRMPDGGIVGEYDADTDGYEPDECTKALEDVCKGKLPDQQLLELFDLAATFRAEPNVGHMWEAVMYLSRAQILRRMDRVRLRKQMDDDELQEGDSPRHTNRGQADPEVTVDQDRPHSMPTRHEHLHIQLPVIPWMTHAYEITQLAFRPDMPDTQLLDLVQLADYMRNYEDNGVHSEDWQQMKRDAANLLVQRISGPGCTPLSDRWPYDTMSWRAEDYRDPMRALPELDVPTLIHLHIQAGENAFLHAREPLQGRWEVVGTRCRAEIIRRIESRKMLMDELSDIDSSADEDEGAESDEDEGTDDDDADDGEFFSIRDALRVAENVWKPDISDAQLLELYVLVEGNGEPYEEDVFDEIATEVGDLLFHRLKKGSPDPKFDRYVPSFDYPDDGVKTLRAVLKGDLPHKNLLMYYRLAWDPAAHGPIWQAVADLCRAQLLRRMRPAPRRGDKDWIEWKRFELARRVTATQFL